MDFDATWQGPFNFEYSGETETTLEIIENLPLLRIKRIK